MKKSSMLFAVLFAAAVLFVSCGNNKIYGKWERDDGVIYEFGKDFISIDDMVLSATYKRSGKDYHVVFDMIIPMSISCRFIDNDTMQVTSAIDSESFELVRIK